MYIASIAIRTLERWIHYSEKSECRRAKSQYSSSILGDFSTNYKLNSYRPKPGVPIQPVEMSFGINMQDMNERTAADDVTAVKGTQ